MTIPALRALRRILRASDLDNRRLAAATGLTLSQLLVLQEIDDRELTTPTALSAALGFTQPTITNICDRLESLGMISRERDADDMRRIKLATTDAGRAAIESAPDQLQHRFSKQFAALPRWEQAMILAGIERLGSILGVADNTAAPLFDHGAISRGSADEERSA